MGNTKDLNSILVAKFTIMLEVPSGKAQTKTSDLQGMIEISFETGKWDHLKTGVADRSKYPCKAITGVLPGKLKGIDNYFYIYTCISLPIPIKCLIRN